jgi:hypothetical protein
VAGALETRGAGVLKWVSAQAEAHERLLARQLCGALQAPVYRCMLATTISFSFSRGICRPIDEIPHCCPATDSSGAFGKLLSSFVAAEGSEPASLRSIIELRYMEQVVI